MKKNKNIFTKLVFSGLIATTIFACSDGEIKNKQSNLSKSMLQNTNYFPIRYEFPIESNGVSAQQDCNDFLCAVVVVPPPATENVGQKEHHWVKRLTTGQITVTFKRNVRDMSIKSLTQDLGDKDRGPVGIVAEIFTPYQKPVEHILQNSCIDGKSYRQGEKCVVGLTYKGMNFTANDADIPPAQIKVKDKINVEFSFHDADLGNNYPYNFQESFFVYNMHASNNQNVGVIGFDSSDTDGFYSSYLGNQYVSGNIVPENIFTFDLKNYGDGPIGKSNDGSLANSVLSVAGQNTSLESVSYAPQRAGSPFDCKRDAKTGDANSNTDCQLYGALVGGSNNSYYGHLEFDYNAQHDTGDKQRPPIRFAGSRMSVLVSKGDFLPMNYDIQLNPFDSNFNPEIKVLLSTVSSSSIAYVPKPEGVSFRVVSNLGVFIPYSLDESEEHISYAIEKEPINTVHYEKQYTNTSELSVSQFNYVLSFQGYPRNGHGGLLVAEYKSSITQQLITQIIGVINIGAYKYPLPGNEEPISSGLGIIPDDLLTKIPDGTRSDIINHCELGRIDKGKGYLVARCYNKTGPDGSMIIQDTEKFQYTQCSKSSNGRYNVGIYMGELNRPDGKSRATTFACADNPPKPFDDSSDLVNPHNGGWYYFREQSPTALAAVFDVPSLETLKPFGVDDRFQYSTTQVGSVEKWIVPQDRSKLPIMLSLDVSKCNEYMDIHQFYFTGTQLLCKR